MPDKKKPTRDINLLPGDDLDNRPGGQLLKWALSWGKKIVIVTELIVVSAFLSRFWLDTQVANLSDDIQHKKDILEASAEFENEFRSVSNRLAGVQKITDTPSVTKILTETEKLLPPGITISRITVTGNELGFSGNGDDATLRLLVDNFKSSPLFKDIVFEKVTTENITPDINFSLISKYQD